jgi:uncharacterized membrane protein YphA (DoxX/SURF4 family)
MDKRVESAWWVLRVALGAGPVIAGADKFFNLLADWPMYLSPLAVAVLPVDPATFMRIVGGVEILVGLAILTNATRIGAWVLMAWLIGLAINLASTGMFFDLAVRDVEIAVAAFALARLTEAREAQAVAAIS